MIRRAKKFNWQGDALRGGYLTHKTEKIAGEKVKSRIISYFRNFSKRAASFSALFSSLAFTHSGKLAFFLSPRNSKIAFFTAPQNSSSQEWPWWLDGWYLMPFSESESIQEPTAYKGENWPPWKSSNWSAKSFWFLIFVQYRGELKNQELFTAEIIFIFLLRPLVFSVKLSWTSSLKICGVKKSPNPFEARS